MAAPEDDDHLIPETGAVFTFGRSRFADNLANKFWIKNDKCIQIACGDQHSAVVTERGRVYVFGNNEWGQLGLGHTKASNKPSFIKVLKPEKTLLVACGRSHTLLYTDSGKLFSFGGNEDGQLGHGDRNNETSPKLVESLSSVKLKEISCGSNHCAALTVSGDVYTWGLNTEGQCGFGDEDEITLPTEIDIENKVVSLSCGYYHTALVTSDGSLYSFGEDETGKLGLTDDLLKDTRFPQKVESLPNGDGYIKVACGARHSVAITKKGKCYSWGDGSHGQLGHGTLLQEVSTPKMIELLKNYKIVEVSCGESHTAVVTDTGKIFTFGDGRHGKLGQGDECFSNLFKPTLISRFNGFHVTKVSCGGCHMLVCAIRTEAEDEEDEDETDSLASSMISRKSIQDANMTLKPGNMTFPTVSKRDKRRMKDEELNQSLNLNGSLNNSLNMAQLSKTVPQLPSMLDKNKLPKIPGMQKPNNDETGPPVPPKRNLPDGAPIPAKRNLKAIEKTETGELHMKQNKRLVAAISFSRNPTPRRKEPEPKENFNENSNEDNRKEEIVRTKNEKNVSNKKINKKDSTEEDDSEYDSVEENIKNNNNITRNKSKEFVKGQRIKKQRPVSEDEEESEEDVETKKESAKNKLMKKPAPRKVSKRDECSDYETEEEESEEEDDDEEEEEEEEEVKKIPTAKKKQIVVKKKQLKQFKEEEEDDDEEEEDDDDDEDEEEDDDDDEEEEEEDDGEEDDEEEEEEEEEEEVKNTKSKKGESNMKKQQDKESKDKKNKKKKKAEDDEDKEDEDDEGEEELDETDGKKNSKKKNGKKQENIEKKEKVKNNKNKKKAKKQEEDDEEDDEDEDEDEEEEEEEDAEDEKGNVKEEERSKSGFFSFLRRNKTKQVETDTKKSGKTDSNEKEKETEKTNQSSKTCVIL